MLLVVGHLDVAAPARLVDSPTHGIGDAVGVHDDLAGHVARRAAYGLDERAVVAQKALLVGIQDGHERHLGQVESLAQKVDAYEHVELAATQIAQDLRTLQGGDVRVHVARLHALIQQMVGQILSHLLCQRRD